MVMVKEHIWNFLTNMVLVSLQGMDLTLMRIALLNGGLCYDTHITNDVMGYLTSEEVTEIMKQIQEL